MHPKMPFMSSTSYPAMVSFDVSQKCLSVPSWRVCHLFSSFDNGTTRRDCRLLGKIMSLLLGYLLVLQVLVQTNSESYKYVYNCTKILSLALRIAKIQNPIHKIYQTVLQSPESIRARGSPESALPSLRLHNRSIRRSVRR